jgi:bacteriocin biosynthesis cyclodehydratase domain-containing protein
MPTEPSSTQPEPTLPVTLRLPPHRSVLRLGVEGRLLGLDPDAALAVDRLTSPLAAMLDELIRPVETTALVARAVERGADPEAAADLLRELVRAGALVDAAAIERRARQRRQSIVLVTGDGPLAVGVVVGLVQAGVAGVYIETAGTVRAGDLGTGYLDADRGRERAASTRDAVRRIRPDADARPAPRRLAPDLVVLADALGSAPARVARLHAVGTAHLPVRLRDGIGVIGPLVLPGRSACLGCLDLDRRARAPDWPSVAAQLTDRPGQAATAATAATAALATAQAVAALDATTGGGARPPTLGASLELDAEAGTIVRRCWTPQAGCGCGAAATAPARAPARVRTTAAPAPSPAAAGGQGHESAASANRRRRERIMV